MGSISFWLWWSGLMLATGAQPSSVHLSWWILPPYTANTTPPEATNTSDTTSFLNTTHPGVLENTDTTSPEHTTHPGVLDNTDTTSPTRPESLGTKLVPPDTPLTANTTSPFQFSGLLADILAGMFQECLPGFLDPESDKILIQNEMNPGEYRCDLRDLLDDKNSSDLKICLPEFRRVRGQCARCGCNSVYEDVVFVPFVEVPGAVYFYKRPEEPVASDLWTVIMQGWPMLVLILLGAGYSGIIIWLLDRLWNETNFPKPFIRGFWEGFWWAFVTMTTVGYGDTTPRSIQARIYGLVWIVVGITILSVFTATVTTVLTQETLAVHRSLQGLTIGVVNGTDDFRLVISKGAQPVIFPTFRALVTSLGAETHGIHGAVVDQYIFAGQMHQLPPDILVESLVADPLVHGALISGIRPEQRLCVTTYSERHRHNVLAMLMQWIKPITVITTTAAENAETLFQPQTVQYMWYGAIVWVLVFIFFITWEFCYWRPKHISRTETKKEIGLKKKPAAPKIAPHSNGYIPRGREKQRRHSTSSSHDFYSCIGKPVKHYDNKAFYTQESAEVYTQKHVSFSDKYETETRRNETETHKIPQHLKTPNITRKSQDKASKDGEFIDENTSLSQLEDCLENMLVRQQKEIESMNQRLSTMKKKHDRCLRELHRKHKAERRRLLDMIKDSEEEKPCDIILVTDNSSGSVHPLNVYDV